MKNSLNNSSAPCKPSCANRDGAPGLVRCPAFSLSVAKNTLKRGHQTARATSNQLLVLRRLRKFGDEFLDLLCLTFMRQQRGIVGLNKNGIAQANNRNRCAVLRAGIKD